MKKFCLIFFLLLSLVSCTNKKSQYSLEIKQSEINQADNGDYIIPVALINNSKDSVSFISMSCSWQELYYVQNRQFKIKQNTCYSNFPVIISIAPKDKKIVNLELVNNSLNRKESKKVKIGFNFIETKVKKTININVSNEFKKQNLIWSNEIDLTRPAGNSGHDLWLYFSSF